ncbi:MAG: hypothetical protein AB7P04_11080 [Bacteriovoracia bacterium]
MLSSKESERSMFTPMFKTLNKGLFSACVLLTVLAIITVSRPVGAESDNGGQESLVGNAGENYQGVTQAPPVLPYQSLYEKLELKNGGIVETVNGQKVTPPAGAMKILQAGSRTPAKRRGNQVRRAVASESR